MVDVYNSNYYYLNTCDDGMYLCMIVCCYCYIYVYVYHYYVCD